MTRDAFPDRSPPDQDLVAAEYALGTLRGPARDRFVQALDQDRALQAGVARWQERLSGLVAGVEPVEPSAALWARIAQAVDAETAADAVRGAALPPGREAARALAARLWDAVALWRGLSLAAVAAACILAVLAIPAIRPPGGSPAGHSLIAVLLDNGRPVFAVSAAPGRPASVTPVGDGAAPAGRSYELWAIAGTAAPVSLGLLDGAAGSAVRIPPDRLPPGLLRPGVVLAVSLEPAGGSPGGAPTGPVLFTGTLVEAL